MQVTVLQWQATALTTPRQSQQQISDLRWAKAEQTFQWKQLMSFLMADRSRSILTCVLPCESNCSQYEAKYIFRSRNCRLLLAGVLLGKVFLATGMLIHELSVLIVILNAIRLIRYTKRKPKNGKYRTGILQTE